MTKTSPKKSSMIKFQQSLKNDMSDYNNIDNNNIASFNSLSTADYGTMVEARPLLIDENNSTLIENNDVEINFLNIFDSENQDGSQIFWAALTLIGELYKAIIGSFLILLVPQNPHKSSDWLLAGTLLNLVTFIFSCLLYALEVTRELNLIMHLDENENRSNNPIEVKKRLKRLPSSTLQNLRCTDCLYKILAWLTVVIFVANMILSSFVILSRFLDVTTVTVYVTSVMFYFYKVGDVITTITQSDYVYVSAYIYKKLHYNDVDSKRYTEDPNNANGIYHMLSNSNNGDDLNSYSTVSQSLMTSIRKSNSRIRSNDIDNISNNNNNNNGYDDDGIILEGIEEGNAPGSVVCVVAGGNNRNISESDNDDDDDDDIDDDDIDDDVDVNNDDIDQYVTRNTTPSLDSGHNDQNNQLDSPV